jgi:adenylate kinase family enzyme
MRLLVFGNSGSGKSTYARRIASEHAIARLDLDSIVWEPGRIAVQRSASDIRRSLDDFIAQNEAWVIEGCYGELIEEAAHHSTELIFLNPGLEACLANNRRREWEPHKYKSLDEQNSMLDKLQEWVAGYYTRTDTWSYSAHRRIFDGHAGRKREITGR